MAFHCGNCKERHLTAADGRACYAGQPVPVVDSCYDLVERTHFDEDGFPNVVIEACGAEAVYTWRGSTCAAGHSYVHAQIRVQEGWEYAEDPQEARQLMKAGVFPMTMDGTGPSEIAPY